MTCYFLLFWFILTLHDRTGRLESAAWGSESAEALHDRTGRLEKSHLDQSLRTPLHDRTGRLENVKPKNINSFLTSRPHRSLRNVGDY
ncbi:hypothetical protein EJK49_1227 [Moraxella catarrhalis]|nr:hypothetical protein EJK49_1227 [Moraxella catarrhalis]